MIGFRSIGISSHHVLALVLAAVRTIQDQVAPGDETRRGQGRDASDQPVLPGSAVSVWDQLTSGMLWEIGLV